MKKTILILLVLCLIPSYLLIFTIPAQATSSTTKSTVKKTVVTKPVAKITTKKTATVKKAVATKTTAVKKTPVKTVTQSTAKAPAKTTTKAVTKVTWSASGLKSVARIPSGVRPAYKAKVENYARRNGIKTITAEVVAGMRE